VPYLTNESASVAADSAGTITGSLSAVGGSMDLIQGTTVIGSGVTYSVVSTTGGLSISINSSTGAYTITALSGDQGSATLRATYGSVNYDKIYSLTKQKQGATGTAGSNGTNGTNGANGATGATGPIGPNGASTFTLYNRANTTVGPNSITSTGGSGWGSSGASSREAFANGAVASFTVANFAQYLVFGLSDSPTSSLSYTDIDYGWNTNPAGEGRIYESGVDVGVVVSVSVGDVLQVAYSGNRIDYTRNNTVIYSHATSGAQVLYLDTAFFGSGAVVSNITFAKAGANGANGGGASSVSAAIDVTTVNWPYPITLENGESIAAGYHLGAGSFSGGGSATVTTWMEISLSGAGSYSTISGTSASNGYVAGDQLSQDGSGSFTNSSGGRKAYDVRFRYSKSGTPNPGAVDHTTSTMTLG
jgi:hypothetical protein